MFVVRHRVWPGADHAHLAAQHVEELRQFIERGASEKGTQRRDPVIAPSGLTHDRPVLLHAHRAKFPDLDRGAIQAVAALSKQHRPGHRESNRRGNRQHQRRCGDQRRHGHGHIEDALVDRACAAKRRIAHPHDRQPGHGFQPYAQRLGQLDIGYEIHRGCGVAELLEQRADTRLCAHRQREIHPIDMTCPHAFAQSLCRAQQRRFQPLRRVFGAWNQAVIHKARQVQSRVRLAEQGAGQRAPQRVSADDQHPIRASAQCPLARSPATDVMTRPVPHGRAQRRIQ